MSMRRIQKLDLARSHIRRELSEGMALAKLVLPSIDLARGQIFAWMPSDRNENSIEDFAYDLLMSRAEEVQEQLGFARFTRAFVQRPSHALILQDTVSDNLVGDKYDAFAARYGQELYWHIADAKLSDDDIWEITRAPILPYPWCGFFYDSAPVAGKTELTSGDLEEIVKTISGVAVGAFHQESYLLWWNERQPLPLTPDAAE